MAKEMEATIRTNLLSGMVPSKDAPKALTFSALSDCYLARPDIRGQRIYREKVATLRRRFNPLFGDHLLVTITPAMIEAYRTTRKSEPGRSGSPAKPAKSTAT